MLRRRGKLKKGIYPKKEGDKEPFNKKDMICHKYKQLGHLQNECPLLNKQSKKKKKTLLSTWEDPENDSTSEEEEEEEISNLCFMAKGDEEVDFSNFTYEEYLLDALDDVQSRVYGPRSAGWSV